MRKQGRNFPNGPKKCYGEYWKIDNTLGLFVVRQFYITRTKKKKEAEELYRLLLGLNPNDNQGVRYLLASLYAGKHPKVADDLINEGNRLQDWSKLQKFLEDQNKKHKFWNPPKL